MRRRGVGVAAGLCAVVLSVSGCGGGSDQAPDEAGSDKSGATADEVLREYLEGVYAGDADACDLETESYAAQSVEALAFFSEEGDPDPSCAERMKKTAGLIEAFSGEGDPDISEATYEVLEQSEDAASVRVTYSADEDEVYGLVYVDGRWLVDSDDSGTGDSSDGSAAGAGASSADTAAWTAAWCDVQVGQTREEAIALMGEPTSEFTVEDDATPQLNWSFGAYSYTAFLDTDGVVNRFYGNYDSLGQSDMEQLPCVAEDEFGLLSRTDG